MSVPTTCSVQPASRGAFSARQMASEYGSSPRDHAVEERAREPVEVIVRAEEVGLVGGDGVDERLQLSGQGPGGEQLVILVE